MLINLKEIKLVYQNELQQSDMKVFLNNFKIYILYIYTYLRQSQG